MTNTRSRQQKRPTKTPRNSLTIKQKREHLRPATPQKQLNKLKAQKAEAALSHFQDLLPPDGDSKLALLERDAAAAFGSRPSEPNGPSKNHRQAIHRLYNRLINESVGLLEHQDEHEEGAHWSLRNEWTGSQFAAAKRELLRVDERIRKFMQQAL